MDIYKVKGLVEAIMELERHRTTNDDFAELIQALKQAIKEEANS